MTHNHLGFVLKSSAIRGNVYVPKYYNPEIPERLNALKNSHDLLVLGDLMSQKQIKASTGDEIGKMAYGTGTIPFIRTSDISNWEMKADPKQGVSEAIYQQYAVKQDVQPGDIFFVRDGTYLIGSACLVTEADRKILYQSHLLKFRVLPTAPISAPLLLALLSAPIVLKQIRAKQFTADIIDSIGNRYQELILPLPRDPKTRAQIGQAVQSVIQQRVELRERIRHIPLWAQGLIADLSTELPDSDDFTEMAGNPGFRLLFNQIRSRIFIPKYYDPTIDRVLKDLANTHTIISVGDLVKQGVLSLATGIEVGKMAYGTGPVPFIRTSDISNWELKADPKQSVSEDLFEKFQSKLDVRTDDLFIVRDGTYLVGTSCILTKHDPHLLYCGGIYKVRVKKPKTLDPYLLLALLNTPIVRQQMRAKQFTRDIIDTIGKRILEVMIPIPKDSALYNKIAQVTRETVETRADLRNQARQIALDIEGIKQLDEDAQELLEML